MPTRGKQPRSHPKWGYDLDMTRVRGWQTKLPARFHSRCLVTIQRPGTAARSVQVGWADADCMTPLGVAWMPMPEHILDDPCGWSSPYRGDDYPRKSGWYLVCFESYRWYIKKLWFDTKKDRFLGLPSQGRPPGDVVAWRPLPEPYKETKGGKQ